MIPNRQEPPFHAGTIVILLPGIAAPIRSECLTAPPTKAHRPLPQQPICDQGHIQCGELYVDRQLNRATPNSRREHIGVRSASHVPQSTGPDIGKTRGPNHHSY